MSSGAVPDEVIDQLRGAWRAAGIAATEEDLAGIVARGFLERLVAFRALLDSGDVDTVPDYLDVHKVVEQAGEPPRRAAASAPEDTLLGVAALIKRRDISPVDLVERALARIAERDPQLNAFQLVLTEQAQRAARYAEIEISGGGYRGPLHGVPVAVKDLFDLAGVPTTAGSKIRAGRPATTNSTVVARLQDAGAIIVGKTRMSEFAYSPGSTNAHYGPTPNPWNPAHDSGGSSSGSAAAVAAGLVYAAIGSDTGGSIRIPAANCGIVGLKPSYGRISLAGAVSLSWTLDHAGPLARSAADAATLLAALAGRDGRDPRASLSAPSFSAELGAGIAGLRVGLLGDDGTGGLAVSDEVRGALGQVGAALERAGARLSPLDMQALDSLRLVNGALIAMEAAAFHLRSLQTKLDDYGPFMRQRVLAAFAYGPGDFVRAQQLRRELRARASAAFAQVDLICAPCVPTVAPELDVPTSTNFTGPFNCLGWPALSLPTGIGSGGLPLAAQLIARPGDDTTLLRAAHAAESGLGRLLLG